MVGLSSIFGSPAQRKLESYVILSVRLSANYCKKSMLAVSTTCIPLVYQLYDSRTGVGLRIGQSVQASIRAAKTQMEGLESLPTSATATPREVTRAKEDLGTAPQKWGNGQITLRL